MSLFKYIFRIKTIHQMIESEKTGPSEVFAYKLGVSRSVLMEHLREMREELNAPIKYCRKRETFYYQESFKLSIVISSGMDKIKGGNISSVNFSQSERTGLYPHNFEVQVNLYAEAEKRF